MTDRQNTQLTPMKGYDVNRMIFAPHSTNTIQPSENEKGTGNMPKIEYKRINISTRNEDGTIGELIIPTERVFSFGVSESVSMETGKITGYTFPLCLWTKDNPTDEEKEWVEKFNEIVDHCVAHILEVQDELDVCVSEGELKKAKGGLNPLYWKREEYTDEKGKKAKRVVPGLGPTLYAKLIYSKKNDRFISRFYDSKTDEPIEPLDLTKKYCYANAAVKIESIFIGKSISLQVKLYEADVEIAEIGMKRLLTRQKADNTVRESTSGNVMGDDDDDENELGSLAGSDKEDEKPEPVEEKPKPKLKPKPRNVKKVVKKA